MKELKDDARGLLRRLKDRCYSHGVELHYANTGRDDNPYEHMRIGKGKEGRLIIDERQAHIVRTVFRVYRKGAAIRAIVKRLNDQGVVTLRGKRGSQSQVQEMSNSAEYTGQFHSAGIVNRFPERVLIDKRSFDHIPIGLTRNKGLARRGRPQRRFALLPPRS